MVFPSHPLLRWHLFTQSTVHPMPLLHRWDSDSDDGEKPAALWRYDETSDGGSGEASSSGECSPLGMDFRNLLMWIKVRIHHPFLFKGCTGLPCWVFKLPATILRHGSSCDDSDDGPMLLEPLNISLTLAGLQSFHGMATKNIDENSENSAFARNGTCHQRVREAVRTPTCSCQCSVPFNIMIKVCVAFWSLAKSAQDAILWSIQTSGSARRKRFYDIEGLVLKKCS